MIVSNLSDMIWFYYCKILTKPKLVWSVSWHIFNSSLIFSHELIYLTKIISKLYACLSSIFISLFTLSLNNEIKIKKINQNMHLFFIVQVIHAYKKCFPFKIDPNNMICFVFLLTVLWVLSIPIWKKILLYVYCRLSSY